MGPELHQNPIIFLVVHVPAFPVGLALYGFLSLQEFLTNTSENLLPFCQNLFHDINLRSSSNVLWKIEGFVNKSDFIRSRARAPNPRCVMRDQPKGAACPMHVAGDVQKLTDIVQ